MSENMFEIRKNDRRRQIIEENLAVADQIIATNPNTTILQNEKVFKDVVVEKEEAEDTLPQEETIPPKEEIPTESEDTNNILPLNLLNYKKKESDKGRYTYYLDNEIDELLIAVADKFEMKSKSILANLLLGTTILLNENIQNLADNDEKIKESFEKLYNKFKK